MQEKFQAQVEITSTCSTTIERYNQPAEHIIFELWYSKLFRARKLSLAWQRVKASLFDDLARDKCGVDLFQRGARENIDQLSALLINGEYKPTDQ